MKQSKTIGFWLVMMLAIGVLPIMSHSSVNIHTDATTDQQLFVVGDLSIRVPTSQVPFYQFWETENNTTVYKIHFDTMFEYNDLNNNSQYDQYNDTIVGQSMTPLAQMTWELSDIVNGTDTISFNLTGDVTGSNTNVDQDLIIQFRNHITKGDNELKFDVIINNYTWKSDDSLLVLAYKLDNSANHIPNQRQSNVSTQARFGSGYMDSLKTATAGENSQLEHQVQSRMTFGNATKFSNQDYKPRIFISYTHFSGDLVHDPTIGLDQSTENTFNADELSIKVPTTSVPFYFFWRTGEDTDTYRVAFDTLFEIVDDNNNNNYEPGTEYLVSNSVFPLSLLDWEMSSIVNTTEDTGKVIHFNLTGYPGNSPQVGDVKIQFNNHIYVNGNESNVKFDIIVNNYEWTSASDDTMLVMGYKITTTNDQYQGTPEFNQSKAVFGDAYMESVQTAFSNNGSDTHQVRANMSIGIGSKIDSQDNAARIYIAYSHFDGNLTHDPTVGLFSVDSDGTDTSSDEDQTSIPYLFIPGLLGLVAIPIIIRKKFG